MQIKLEKKKLGVNHMVLLFLLSFHLFLMAGYVVLIETKKSRLSYGYLVFALFVPFIGELCLLAADLGKSPASNKPVMPFRKFEETVSGECCEHEIVVDVKRISRTQLLQIIKKNPANITEILREALESEDTEVIHIAASSIMKIQSKFEGKIRLAQEQYEQMSNHMGRLKSYIDIISEYYATGLISGNTALSLLNQQEELIDKYLKVLPEDREVRIISIKNSMYQSDYEVALTKAELFRNSDLSDINAWELTLLICTKLNDKEKISEVLFESERFEKYWSGKDKERWKDIRKGFGI